jgi:predicted DNA-binding transcriptional regulator AlpA
MYGIASIPPLPETGYLRIPQIIGDKKRGIPAIFPVSRSTFYAGIKAGKYPARVKLSERISAWRVEDIRALIERSSSDET